MKKPLNPPEKSSNTKKSLYLSYLFQCAVNIKKEEKYRIESFPTNQNDLKGTK